MYIRIIDASVIIFLLIIIKVQLPKSEVPPKRPAWQSIEQLLPSQGKKPVRGHPNQQYSRAVPMLRHFSKALLVDRAKQKEYQRVYSNITLSETSRNVSVGSWIVAVFAAAAATRQLMQPQSGMHRR